MGAPLASFGPAALSLMLEVCKLQKHPTTCCSMCAASMYSQVSSYSVCKYIHIYICKFYFSLKLKTKIIAEILAVADVGVLVCWGAGCTIRVVAVWMSQPCRTSLHLLHRVADLLQTEFAGSLREQP